MLKQIPNISVINNNPFLISKIFSWFSPGNVVSFHFFLKISPLLYCLCCLQYWLFLFFLSVCLFMTLVFLTCSGIAGYLSISVLYSIPYSSIYPSLYFAYSRYHRLPAVRWGQGRHSQEGARPLPWKQFWPVDKSPCCLLVSTSGTAGKKPTSLEDANCLEPTAYRNATCHSPAPLYPLALSSLLCPLLQSCPAHARGWDFLLSWFSTHWSYLSLFETPSVFLAHWQYLLLLPHAVTDLFCRLSTGLSIFAFVSEVRVDLRV